MKRREVLQAASIGSVTVLSGCQEFSQGGGDENHSNISEDNPENGSSGRDDSDDQNNNDSSDISEVRVSHDGSEIEVIDQQNQEVLYKYNSAGEGLQTAIDEIDGNGTVTIGEGTYVIGDGAIQLASDISLIGEGSSKPVLQLADGLHQEAHSVLWVGAGVSDVTIRNIEIDGNESNNRQIEPFPDSPHGHGLGIHGDGNGEKPKRISVENIHSHDTIRSNVLLGGVDCTLEDLELENAATDHWVYLARAEECELKDITASGFTRGGGVVFGTPGYQCTNNTVSNIVISDAKKPPHENPQPNNELSRKYPLIVCIFRPDGDGYQNTLKNVQIDAPAGDFSHRVVVGQPDTTIEDLDFAGPVGYTPNVLQLGVPVEDSSIEGSVVDSATFEITDHTGPHTNPPIIASFSSDVHVSNCEINGTGQSHPGVSISGIHRHIEGNEFHNIDVRTDESALIVDGTVNPITDLSISGFSDVNGAGTDLSGEIEFSEKDIDN